jgi:23S rRNA (cytidine1920-2'-O)/16S rRNA (cytidine1409-2'-O)-methyltransferase
VKRRLDELLVSRGLADRIETARALILAGRVAVEGGARPTAGLRIAADSAIEISGPSHPFVSRGGVKLEAALEAFGIPVEGRVCLDVGTSTGGFTDCFLQRGAARVYAIDTGYGQIDMRLRADPRVVLRENTNARSLDSDIVPEPVAVAAIDVSFISARMLLDPVASRLEKGGALIVLVKPQFEARREEVPRGGVLTDTSVQERVVGEIRRDAVARGLSPLGEMPSPILGSKGNREFLLAFVKR